MKKNVYFKFINGDVKDFCMSEEDLENLEDVIDATSRNKYNWIVIPEENIYINMKNVLYIDIEERNDK